MVYIGRTPGKDPPRAETKAREFGEEVIRQFTQDVHIWQHQRYSDPPALASAEYEGFTAIRKWAMQFYPDGLGGSAAELLCRIRERSNRMSVNRQADPRVPGGHGQRRLRDDQAHRRTQPDLELIGVHCYSPDKIGKDAGELAGIGAQRRDGHRHRSTRSSRPSPTC